MADEESMEVPVGFGEQRREYQEIRLRRLWWKKVGGGRGWAKVGGGGIAGVCVGTSECACLAQCR